MSPSDVWRVALYFASSSGGVSENAGGGAGREGLSVILLDYHRTCGEPVRTAGDSDILSTTSIPSTTAPNTEKLPSREG